MAHEWPTLLCDNARSGGQAPQPWRAPGRARWQASVEGAIRGSPVLHGDLLYVPSQAGFLNAINIRSGRLQWRFKAPAAIHSTPSISSGRVLFGCSDGKVIAIDAVTGTKSWETAAEDEVWTSPVVQNDTVFFGSADGAMYAVQVGTGTLLSNGSILAVEMATSTPWTR